MSSIRGAIGLGLMLALPLHAQRYRVVVSMPETTKLSVLEFRPCIPAEGSECGAWVDRVIDADSAGGSPRVLREQATPNRRTSVAIRESSVTIMSLAKPDSGKSKRAAGVHGTPSALVVSGDSQYAFAVTSGLAGGPAEVCMIDLDWKSVVARLRLPVQPIGISMTR